MALTERANEIDLRICALDRALKLADVFAGWGGRDKPAADKIISDAKSFEAFLRGESS